MSLSCRRFLVDQEGRLVRLKNTTFERLVRDPLHHTMPAMADQRVRMAELLVELSNRIPIRVVRRVYFVLAFDDTGRVDTERFRKQQWALAESALDPALALPEDDESVLDAALPVHCPRRKVAPAACLGPDDRRRCTRKRRIAAAVALRLGCGRFRTQARRGHCHSSASALQ